MRRYTKVKDEVFDLEDIPEPVIERELAWLLSFAWHVDQPYSTLAKLAAHRAEGTKPSSQMLQRLQQIYHAAARQGLQIPGESQSAPGALGLQPATE